MHDTIKKLADTIASNNLEEINRQLRIVGRSIRNPNQVHLRTEIENDKKIFLLAHAFLTQHGKPNENWRTSQTCFEQLTDWFEQTTDIENHLQLSMVSWYCQLDQTLENAINPNQLIPLGSAYYAEPHKFMGFLFWLLENRVMPRSIIQSAILHRFFEYHAFEMNVLEESYALLTNLSNNTNTFLSFLEKKSCGMRGFIDHHSRRSYNLLGKNVSYEGRPPEYNPEETRSLYLELTCLNYAEQLFSLFEWELIKKLNFTQQTDQRLLGQLLNSQMKTKILSELPRSVLQGQFSIEFTHKIFTIIEKTYRSDELLAITLSEPFYVHAFNVDSYSYLFLEPNIINGINTLCYDEKYHTLHHLPFLAELACKLANRNPLQVNLILRTIVDIILPFGDAIHDSAIQPIHYIYPRLRPFFLEKMMAFLRNIDTAIRHFIDGEIDYNAVTHLWGSQLSVCNLIFSLQLQWASAISYPRSIYQLHTRVLQKKCDLCIVNEELLPLENMLSIMTPDAETQKRILQEALVDPASQAALIETILNYWTQFFPINSLIFTPFGVIKNVVFHACTTHAEKLQIVLFKNHDVLTDALTEAIRYNDIAFTKMLCNLSGAYQLTRDDIKSALFGAAIQWETWEIIGLLCGLSGDDTINPDLIKAGNIHLYFNIINKYQKHYKTKIAPTDAFLYINDQNETPLHFAANHCSFKKFEGIFNKMKKAFIEQPEEIYALLNARTISNQIVACTTDHAEKREINAFLNRARDEYKRYERDAASTVDGEDQDELEEDATPIIRAIRNRLFSPTPNRPNRRRERSEESTQEEQDAAFNATWPR